MLYVKIVRNTDPALGGKIVSAEVTDDHPRELNSGIEHRWDWKTFDDAEDVAAALGPDYIATDAGQWTSPRYDVIKLPKVGNKVSKCFNGDHYPCGVIVKISKTLKCITTDGGDVFYRVRQTGSWRNENTWFLEDGHVSKLNPSF